MIIKLWKIRSRSKDLDNCPACGVGYFATGQDDPFLSCCITHDAEYSAHHAGLTQKTEKEVDDAFAACVLKIAGTDTLMKIRARSYIALVRLFGPPIWNEFWGIPKVPSKVWSKIKSWL